MSKKIAMEETQNCRLKFIFLFTINIVILQTCGLNEAFRLSIECCFTFRQQPVQVKKDEKETNKLPCTEVKRFSEVDASVVDVFKAPADAPFSLGALFGREESSDEEAESQSGKWLVFNSLKTSGISFHCVIVLTHGLVLNHFS